VSACSIGCKSFVEAGSQSRGDLDSAVQYAAGYGHADVVRVLLARGANPAMADDAGQTRDQTIGLWDLDRRERVCVAAAGRRPLLDVGCPQGPVIGHATVSALNQARRAAV